MLSRNFNRIITGIYVVRFIVYGVLAERQGRKGLESRYFEDSEPSTGLILIQGLVTLKGIGRAINV